MRSFRWFFLTAGVLASVAIAAACVGDDPGSGDTIAPPGEDSGGGGTPDTGSSGNIDSGNVGNDSGNVQDSGADVVLRHCQTVSKPVAPTEFFCADFDGPDASEGWTTTVRTDGGTLDLTTSAFTSPPQGLVVHPAIATGTGSGPELNWKSVGAMNFQKAVLRAHMNPTNPGGVTSYTGIIKLLEITTTNALVAFYYTEGANLVSNPASNNYVGYFIKAAAFGGAAVQSDYPVTTPLSPTTWTDVKLTWQSTNQVDLSYNNVSVFNKAIYGSVDTSVTFTIGAASSGQVSEPKQMRYDDVEITLDRMQ